MMTLLVVFVIITLSLTLSGHVVGQGILYPEMSESRDVRNLDGYWNFRVAPALQPNIGFEQNWFTGPLEQTGPVDVMPVPSSYNDITLDIDLRDHIGWAWYDRTFWVPSDWQTGKRIFLRFGAAHYTAIVYVNGQEVVQHAGGALPFVTELNSPPLNFNSENLLTVALNSTLNEDTCPQGFVTWQGPENGFPAGYRTLEFAFDFFNYAGLHRSVMLYATPRTYVDDIDVVPSISGTTGMVSYAVRLVSDEGTPAGNVMVSLVDKEGTTVATGQGTEGDLVVENAKLWWPFTMVKDDSDAGYLYSLVIKVVDPVDPENLMDVYRLPVGIRTVTWSKTEFFINGKTFYFRGFGRHEDNDSRGKGLDAVMVVKDHNLVKWTGANSYRTSHYPYSEEIMRLADRLGIVIIDESPAATIDLFGQGLLANHKQAIRELIQRDKNHPSVVMWSVANEPRSQHQESDQYFKEICDLARQMDPAGRPLMLVTNQAYNADYAVQHADIIGINRYYSWYSDTGHPEVVLGQMIIEVNRWAEAFDRPIFVTEYGADTVAGLHRFPDFVYSEEYQTRFMREHFRAFDSLRGNSSLIGEHVWNFADFMTNQEYVKVGGNKKGIFTRDRQPKASAHLLRHRYHLLAAEYDGYPIPLDLQESSPVYIPEGRKQKPSHDEH